MTINKINFVGDLSKADVKVLIRLMKKASSILEFGVGGSTQLFAQYTKPGTRIISVDTDSEWIEKTKKNLEYLPCVNLITFLQYNSFQIHYNSTAIFDFIFDDGIDHFRLDFALTTWKCLPIGGIMAFHDTRRLRDMNNVLKVVHDNYLEVAEVQMNVSNSNISYIKKKESEPWVNWNHVEGKELWETGIGNLPEGWPKI